MTANDSAIKCWHVQVRRAAAGLMRDCGGDVTLAAAAIKAEAATLVDNIVEEEL